MKKIIYIILILIFMVSRVNSTALDYYFAAKKKLEIGKLDNAIMLYKKALESDPSFAAAYIELGKIYILRGDNKKAESTLKKAIINDPSNIEPYINIGLIYMNEGDYRHGEKIFLDALEIDSTDERVIYNYANSLFKQERVEESMVQLEKVLTETPHDLNSRILKGKIFLYYRSDFEGAERLFGDILKTNSKNNDVIYEYGVSLEKSKKYKLAITNFLKIINDRDQNKSSKIYYKIAFCYKKLRKWKQSEKNFEMSLIRRPNFSEARNDLGKLLFETGRIREAMEQFKKAYRTNPTLVEAGRNYGESLFILKNYDESLGVFQELITHHQKNGYLYNSLGMVYTIQKEYGFAINAFEKAIEIDKKLDSPYYNLAYIYDEQEKYDEAIEMYKKALTYNKNNIMAMNNLGYLYINLKRYNEAVNILKDAIKINKRFTWAYYNLILASYNRGDKKQATYYVEKLFKYEKKDTELYKATMKLSDLINYF